MGSYQPKPDETALLTVEARLDSDGMYVIKGEDRCTRVFLHSKNPIIVRVEPLPKPALPTAFGSLIRATFHLPGADQPERTELAKNSARDHLWLSRSGMWLRGDQLSDVEVLHDPDAAKPTAEAAAPTPEPEPLKPPTKFGTVAWAMNDGVRVLAILADTDSGCWRVHRDADSLPMWKRGDELTAIEILAPGVDVDLP